MGSREDSNVIELGFDLSGQGVDLGDPVNFIPEKFHPHCHVRIICWKDFQHISPHAEGTTVKVHVISVILDINQLPHHIIPVLFHARTQGDDHVLVILRASNAVDTGYTGDNDNILPLTQGGGCGETELVDLVVDGGVFCYIGVG